MTKRTLLGMLTPSSNTVLEPVTSRDGGRPARASLRISPAFKVTEIALSTDALGAVRHRQHPAPRLELLARCPRSTSIGWSGTSSGWLGFETRRPAVRADHGGDRHPRHHLDAGAERDPRHFRRAAARLCHALSRRRAGEDHRQLCAAGILCGGDRHLGLQDNFSFAEVTAPSSGQIREVAAEKPDAIAIVCTNLRAAPLVNALEAGDGELPILDSIATVVWKSLAGSPAPTCPV